MTSRTEYNKEALAIVHEMIDKLARLEASEFKLLSAKWGVVSGQLETLILKLAEKEYKTKNQIYREKQYKEFLEQSTFYVDKFDKVASGIILDNKERFSEIGVNSTYEMIDRFGVGFNKLSPERINTMIGLTKDESPLYNLLAKSYPKTVENLVDTLIKSQALGYNPTKTAKLMLQDMEGNKIRALLVARTEQLRSNREASLMSMKQSGVCKGWIRIESVDASTCSECEEANGTKHGFDEEFDSHPNCRGAVAPLVG